MAVDHPPASESNVTRAAIAVTALLVSLGALGLAAERGTARGAWQAVSDVAPICAAVVRLPNNPIITPATHPTIGTKHQRADPHPGAGLGIRPIGPLLPLFRGPQRFVHPAGLCRSHRGAVAGPSSRCARSLRVVLHRSHRVTRGGRRRRGSADSPVLSRLDAGGRPAAHTSRGLHRRRDVHDDRAAGRGRVGILARVRVRQLVVRAGDARP